MNLTLIKKEKFNTNNAWGFGGGYGTETTYTNGLVQRKGKACFRHTGTVPFDNWYILIDGEKHNIGGRKIKDSKVIYKVTFKYKKEDDTEPTHSHYFASKDEEDGKKQFNKLHPNFGVLINIEPILTIN